MKYIHIPTGNKYEFYPGDKMLHSTKRKIYFLPSVPFALTINSKDWEKIEKKIFTTEDGVDIFNIDKIVFEVITSNFHLNENIPLEGCNEFTSPNFPSKIFSTKKAAEMYILENKSCLSAKDIMKKGQTLYDNPNLLKLVKSKIKL